MSASASSRRRSGWWWVAVPLALVLGALLAAGIDSTSAPAHAQAGSAGGPSIAQKLRINQRISQAAVRRSNEALRRLNALGPPAGGAPGGPGQPAPPIAPTAPTAPSVTTLFARVGATGNLMGGVGATAATQSAVGEYAITFDRPVAGCAVSTTTNSAQPVYSSFVLAGTNRLRVHTWSAAGTAINRNVHVTLTCPPPA